MSPSSAVSVAIVALGLLGVVPPWALAQALDSHERAGRFDLALLDATMTVEADTTGDRPQLRRRGPSAGSTRS